MTAWEWTAGSWCGITGTRRLARRHAAELLRSGEASSAELQMVTVVTEVADLGGRYAPVSGTRREGRRQGAGIRWRALSAGGR